MNTSQQITKELTPRLWNDMDTVKGLSLTGSSTQKSQIVIFDPTKRRKGVMTGDSLFKDKKIASIDEDKTALLSEELLLNLRKAVEITESISLPVKLPSQLAYDELNVHYAEKIREAEDEMYKIQAKFNLFKYYSFVWIVSAIAVGVFITVGIAGLLSPFPSITGVVAIIVGMFGAYLDWKDREKKYDS